MLNFKENQQRGREKYGSTERTGDCGKHTESTGLLPVCHR